MQAIVEVKTNFCEMTKKMFKFYHLIENLFSKVNPAMCVIQGPSNLTCSDMYFKRS